MKEELLRINKLIIRASSEIQSNPIDFCLYQDEFLCLFGSSDSGIDALANSFKGSLPVYCKSIYLENKRLRSFQACLNHISYIGSVPYLFELFNVTENIFTITKNKKFIAYSSSNSMKKTLDFFSGFSVNITPTQKPSDLSLAEKHIVLIAKAYLSGAKIIVLNKIDDFYTKSDYEVLIRFLLEFDNRISIIYITNMDNDIIQLADRVTIMKNGLVKRMLHKDEINKENLLSYSSTGTVGVNRIQKTKAPDDRNCYNFRIEFSGKINSFRVYSNEVLYITEHNNNKTISEFISALRTPDPYSNSFNLNINNAYIHDYSDLTKDRIYVVTQECRFTSHHAGLSNMDNLSFHLMLQISQSGIVNKPLLRFAVSEWMPSYIRHNNIPSNHWRNYNELLHSLAIANAKIIILENPTAQLDTKAQDELFLLLSEFASHGISIIIVSEYKEYFSTFADQTIYFDTPESSAN